jgi:hypothetical protein
MSAADISDPLKTQPLGQEASAVVFFYALMEHILDYHIVNRIPVPFCFTFLVSASGSDPLPTIFLFV